MLFFLATTASAKSFSLSSAADQANDGDFCSSIYSCSLSTQEISLLNTQDDQGYQIKDHTGIFTNGAWPQIYFAPDRYLEFQFHNPNLSTTDTILSSDITISHQTNQVQGLVGQDYDVKLEASKDNGSTWETISTSLWPPTPAIFQDFQVSLPADYLNKTSLNSLLTRFSIYGDDGFASLSSILDLVKLEINYFNSQTNTPPNNTINAPTENQPLKGNFSFQVTLTDDFGLTEYQLNLLDENKVFLTNCLQAINILTTSVSVSCQIDSDNYTNGQYYLQAKTKDNAGEYTETNRSVTFDNASPITDLLSLLPQDDQYWKDSIPISGTSEDNLVTSFVNLYFKESNTINPWISLTTLTNSIISSIFNWSYSWDPLSSTGPGEGTYDLAISATDTAGNQEIKNIFGLNTAFTPSLFPIISNQKGTTPSFGEIKISWDTQVPTSGRVVYDTVSHSTVDSNHPNYGYGFSSGSINLFPKDTSHTLYLTNLSDTTIYYYRIISTSTPTTVGEELTNKTLSPTGSGESFSPGLSPSIIIESSSPINPQISPVEQLEALFAPTSISPQESPSREDSPVGDWSAAEVSPGVVETTVLGTTTSKPKTWMLYLSIFLSTSYLTYLLFRRR